MAKILPNILITGTPGTGKTTTAQSLSERINYRYVNVGDLVIQNNCHEGRDLEYDSYILDEDKICDVLEPLLSGGGCVVDFHSCEFFPERWFELVLVLHANTEVLFDRLVSRNYSRKKIDENMESEIMQVVLEAARDSYQEEIVHSLASNNIEDMESNILRVEEWLHEWKKNNLT